MRSHLSPLDAVLLELEQEDETTHMHAGWVAVLDPPPNGERPSLERLQEQLRERVGETSMLRRRLSMPRVGLLSLPVWLPDPDFDVGQQVSRAQLPQPGGEEELMDWLGDYFGQRLDRSSPLWETVLLEGLEGNRCAVVTKLHHCLVDGISGANLVASTFDTEAEPTPEETQKRLGALVSFFTEEAARGVLMRLRGVVGEAVSGGVDAAIHPQRVREILAQSRETAEMLLRDELVPATRTSLNEPIGAHRRLVGVDVPLADVERVTEELGGTLNDVVLALVAGGLRRLFAHRSEEVEQVRMMAPVGLRHASESVSLGSKASSLFFGLPVSEPDPRRRYQAIVAMTEGLRSGDDGAVGDAARLADLPLSLVQTIVARLAFAPHLSNIAITSIPVSPFTLHALGAPVSRVIPLVPIFSAHALSVTAASYDDNVFFGLHADRDAVPDLEVMRDGVEEALRELVPVAV